MGKRHKKALMSNLIILLTHLLKYEFQPNKRTISWISTIQEHSKRLNEALRKSPSLKNYLVEIFTEAYSYARVEASREAKLPVNIFPIQCPFAIENILNPDYLPE